MDQFTIPIFRYQYKVPKGNIPCDYLESPQDIRTLPPQTSKRNPNKIITREHGGSSDNHVQWVDVAEIVPDSVFHGISQAHGVIRHPSWQHSVGDKIWLRSDMPLFNGRKAPIVNLTRQRSAEAYIRDVSWRPQKRQKSHYGGTRLLTISGPVYPWRSDPPFYRMVVTIDTVQERENPLPTVPDRRVVGCDGDDYYDDQDQEVREVSEVRARMDCVARHCVLELVEVEEIEEEYEDVVGLVGVSDGVGGVDVGGRGGRSVEEGGTTVVSGDDVSKQILDLLVVCFSRPDLSLDLGLGGVGDGDV